MRDRLAEFFIGGSPELEDLSHISTPQGMDLQAFSK
jgi:hypothetical protein